MDIENDPYDRLCNCLGNLTREQKDNLLYHVEKGTPILASGNAALFSDGLGGG